MPAHRFRFASFLFLSGLLLLIVACSAVLAGDVSYSYDARGRLLTAIDNTKYCPSSGSCTNGNNGVQYSYDPAGNINSISLLGSGTAVVYGLSADSGPIGSTLIIEGDQFITQAGQGASVYFPGSVSATVTKVTVSEIDISVPQNATSGQLKVVTPNLPSGSTGLPTPYFTVTP